MLTLDKIYHAAYVLQNVIRRTDLISAPKINPESNIYLKPENLQLTGSFKIRGSYYKISQLSDAEKTKGYQWLVAHCHEYGFILRYPNNTTDVTGIIYEPWHFRYVGEEAATEIMEAGITLEEYLSQRSVINE